MARLAFLQFYPNDWLADPAVRACSVAARGLWMDMLSLMHLSARRGYLLAASGTPLTPEQLARLTGCSAEEVSRLLAELRSSGVFSCTDDGTIFSRRMVRDEGKREKCRVAGRAGGLLSAQARTLEGQVKGGGKGGGKGQPKLPETRDQRPYGEDAYASSCPEPDQPATVPNEAPLLTFPCVGTGAKEWHLTGAKLAEWEAAFPNLDALSELRKARQWILDNPGRRKTAAGMTKFLGGWLGRAQDRGGPSRTSQPNLFGLDYAGRTESRILAQVAESLLPQPPE